MQHDPVGFLVHLPVVNRFCLLISELGHHLLSREGRETLVGDLNGSSLRLEEKSV